jgi:DNA repair exonuclease SbcCD ATPase subunit
MGGLSCTLCECTLYRPNTADDPFKNSVQQKMVRFLAMARESDSTKTRKLGAKIEELLGELELTLEDELAYKAQLAQQEKERTQAEKNLQEARELLAQAEQEMSKFVPVKKTVNPRTGKKLTKLQTCDVCGKETYNTGAHKRFAHPKD